MAEEGVSLPEGPFEGGCQCGRVRFRVARLAEAGHLCHCRMCQKAVGNFFAALVGVAPGDLAWIRGTPARWNSSESVARGFCAACGTPLFWESEDGIGLSIGAFDRAAEIPVAWQSDTYARHPSLGPLDHLRADHVTDTGRTPASRQQPDA